MLSEEKLLASPYMGLVPFSEEDKDVFFGRDREKKVISANLRTRRLTLLYGPTAVGKSSVLMAGVVPNLSALNSKPQLAHAGFWKSAPEVYRFDLSEKLDYLREGIEGLKRQLVIVAVFSKWSGDPLISLKNEIGNALNKSLPDVFTKESTAKLAELELPFMLQRIFTHPEVLQLLIILDQFEEYFVYHPAKQKVADEFADQFCRAVTTPELRANFLISIREDWVARLDRFKRRIPFLFDNSIRIGDLNGKAAAEAIKGPVDKYNEIVKARSGQPGFDKKRVAVKPKFVDEVIKQLEELDGGDRVFTRSMPPASDTELTDGRIQASRLQIVLKYLWEKATKMSPPDLTFELVRKPNTAKRIINTNLHTTLNRLYFWEKLIAADFFRFLVNTSSASSTKVSDTAAGLAARTGRKIERIKPVLDKLSGPDFKVLDRAGPSPGEGSPDLRYQLTSDALADPILDWVKDVRATKSQFLIAGVGLVVVLVLVAIFVFVYWAREARDNQRIAEARQADAEEARIKQQRAFDALKALDDRIRNSKAVLRRHGDRVTSAVFTANGNVLTASVDGTAILWDVEKNEPIQEFDTKTKQVISAAINPGGDGVVTAGEAGAVIFWRVGSDNKSELRARGSNKATGVSFSPDGTLIAVTDATGVLTIWNSGSGQLIKQLAVNNKPLTQPVFSPTGKLLAAASDDNTVYVWSTLDWSQQRSLIGNTGRINSLVFSPNEKLLATGSADTTARIWDLSTGALRDTFRGHTQSINNVDFNNDGLKLLTASDDFTARIWLLDSEKPINLIPHTDKVLSASFNPESDRVVTASGDGVVRIWSAASGQNLAELRGHIDQVTYVTYSSDGKYILSAGDSTARVWHAEEPGNFDVAEPRIEAIPSNPIGECPITIRFAVNLTVNRGSGKITYRFRGSDGRIWPSKEVVFDRPGTTYVNWYWKITESFTGSETIEILEPKGIKAQKAPFAVVCVGTGPAQPPATPATAP